MEVVVVGGGTAALAAVKVLCKSKEVRKVYLISPRTFYEYVPSVLRCMVEPDHLAAASTEIAHALRRYRAKVALIFEAVALVEETRATLAGGRQIAFDYCVIATGATYDAPIHPGQAASFEPRLGELKDWRRKLDGARRILVVGGGITGVELAAELAAQKPRREVTIVASSSTLIPELGPKAAAYAARHLTRKSVRVICGARAEHVQGTQYRVAYKENGGGEDVIDCDISVKCFGGRANGALVGAEYRDSSNRIIVGSDLAVTNMGGRVFAAGDVAASFGQHAFYAEFMGETAGQNVLRHASRSTPLRYPDDSYGLPYEPTLTVVSLGKWDGILMFGGVQISGILAAVGKMFLEAVFLRFLADDRLLGFVYPAVANFALAVLRLGEWIRPRPRAQPV